MKTLSWAIGAAVIALVGGVAVFFLFLSPSATPTPNAGGQFNENNYQYLNKGATVGTTAAGADDLSFPGTASTSIGFATAGGLIGPRQRVDYWQNTTGATVYVDSGLYGTTGTASSTFNVSMFATTTSPTVLAARYDYTALTEAINGTASFLSLSHAIATSTVATTTNSQMELKMGRGNGVIAVPNNGYLITYLQQLPLGGGGATCNGASCEAATSSMRGFSGLFWRAHYVR